MVNRKIIGTLLNEPFTNGPAEEIYDGSWPFRRANFRYGVEKIVATENITEN